MIVGAYISVSQSWLSLPVTPELKELAFFFTILVESVVLSTNQRELLILQKVVHATIQNGWLARCYCWTVDKAAGLIRR
jgi:hypothetical protein